MSLTACLMGGPFDGSHPKVVGDYAAAPAMILVCVCPCCDLVAATTPESPQAAALWAEGATFVRYKLVDAGLEAIAFYDYEDGRPLPVEPLEAVIA